MSEFLEAIKALGIAGGPVFAVLWWLERAERLECQKITRDLLTQSLTTTVQATNFINTATAAFKELKEGIQVSERSLTQLIRSSKRVAGEK